MKKTLASLAGLTVLGGFVVWAGWAAAQQPGSAIQQTKATSNTNTATPASPQRPGTVVGVVNMNSVLKNYLRAQELNTKIKALLTDDQKAKWKTMTGEPFKGEIRFGPPGGRQ